MSKIHVIGAGSWGTALARLLCDNGHEVLMWTCIESEVEMLNEKHEHTEKLPGVRLPEKLTATLDMEEVLLDPDMVVLAVPSPFSRSTLKEMAKYAGPGLKVVSVAKGVEDETFLTIGRIIEEELTDPVVAALSGPSHAEEVVRGLPTSVVAASKDRAFAEEVQNVFMSPVFRVYVNPDVLGVELGGSLKNVIALAAGIADGLGYGDNCKAALITRGIHEISNLAVKMGARSETLYGLSGIGDLIVTCASKHSRNRNAGYLIGQGRTMEEAMAEVKQIVEGVYSAKAAYHLSLKFGTAMPIVEEVHKVLFEGKNAREAVAELMLRDKRVEHENLDWT